MCNKANYILAIIAATAMFFATCKTPPPPEPLPQELSEFFVKANVSGNDYFLEDQKDGFLTGSSQSNDHVGGDGYWNLGAIWAHLSGNQQMFQVNFQHYYFGPETISLEDFEAMFQVGLHDPFLEDSIPGVIIIFKDGNNTWWSSEDGPQDNWRMEITAAEKIEGGWTGLQKVSGNFDCTVYDGPGGNSLEIVGAKFVGRMTQPQ